MSNLPTRTVVIERLQNGDRDPIGDADGVRDDENMDIKAIHNARSGAVVIQWNYDKALECTAGGGVYSFRLLGEEE
jgi:hypothetical protein